ncbi:MAG TPA: nucleotidyltransferase family protein [Burkholderiales bacterium]|nr:nucleotidyltransferase family protein [Burkholderiales bacterium]
MEAIVLAGGLGTRLRSAVPELPKPMAPVAGRPFLEYLLDYWIGQGVTRFILSVGYRQQALREHFGGAYRAAGIAYAGEEQPLGTGGGLRLACGLLAGPGPFLVLNGDTYFEVPLEQLVRFHRAHRAEATLALFRSPQHGRYGAVRLGEQGEILCLESAGGKAGGLANGGVYLMERGLPEGGPWHPGSALSLEDDILPHALAGGRRICGMVCAGRFLDIGLPEDYARAARMLAGEP